MKRQTIWGVIAESVGELIIILVAVNIGINGINNYLDNIGTILSTISWIGIGILLRTFGRGQFSKV